MIDQSKFRFNEISKIENYFNQEIKERKLNSKKLNKFVAAFDYIDKILLFLTVIGAPVGIASASFTLIYITEYNKK